MGACAAIAYLLLRDAVKYRFYRSIGKILFSLRPVLTGPDQGAVTLKVSAKRNALLLLAVAMLPLTVILIFISPLLALGCLLLILGFFAAEFALSASKDGRTLHDRLAKTTVIDIRSDEAKATDLEMRRGEGSRRAASVK